MLRMFKQRVNSKRAKCHHVGESHGKGQAFLFPVPQALQFAGVAVKFLCSSGMF